MDEEQVRRAELERLRKQSDWHSLHVTGVKLAMMFVLFVPTLSLILQFTLILLGRPNAGFVGLDNVIWMCAAGIATMLAFAFRGRNDGTLPVNPNHPEPLLAPGPSDAGSNAKH